jgi:hypothetical protein
MPHYFLRDLCVYSLGLAVAASFMRSKGEVSYHGACRSVWIIEAHLYKIILPCLSI